MNSNIFENKAFDCIDHNIKKAFLNLNENMKNKSSDEKIALIIAFVQSLPKDITFTKDEREAMINALTENMNIKEKQQMNILIRMIGM